ncbi:MAG: MotA/TolQ/ExbB proton channel family protein [Oceanococcaceae bacterium]
MNALIAVAELIDQGGPLLPVLFATAILLFIVVFERYVELWLIWPRARRRMVGGWMGRGDRYSTLAQRIREGLLSEARTRLELTLPLLAALVAICPLLGLLGTVTGMMTVFDVMAVAGTAEPRAMAAGISQATLPTMAGMVIALPGLFFFTRLRSRARRAVDQLADQLDFV